MKNKRKKINIILPVLISCILIALVLAFVLPIFNSSSPSQGDGSPVITGTPSKTPSISELFQAVVSIKDNLVSVLNDLKSNNLENTPQKLDAISENVTSFQAYVSALTDAFKYNSPLIKKQLVKIQDLLDLADMAIEKLLKPAIVQMQTYPISDLRVGDGLNTALLGKYIDFVESIMPDLEVFIGQASSVDWSLIDKDGKISDYLETANELLEVYKKDNTILSKFKAMLGAEEDRLYLIAVQNSSEIRASGGFPGSMGAIRIVDGILTMDDFKRVYDTLSSYTPPAGNVTALENNLFHYGLSAPRDADYCPDFERVATVWALGYQARQNESIDGVISMTPCVMQRLLSVLNAEIELFDGTVLNKDNATRVLQYDLYFKYYGKNFTKENEETTDQLFAEAAKKMMQVLMGNLSISQITEYFHVAKESFENRTLMLWMLDEAEQKTIAQLGWNGGLNKDPENPQAGVYYSCTIPSKMGIFLIMNTDIGERVQNADGSYTYPITVTLRNNITPEEIQAAHTNIIGTQNGTLIGSVYLFAPAGGTVGDFISSNYHKIQSEVYQDLDLGYMLYFSIYPQEEVTITYSVTTAPGVDTPLTISKTPTLQDYLQ